MITREVAGASADLVAFKGDHYYKRDRYPLVGWRHSRKHEGDLRISHLIEHLSGVAAACMPACTDA